MRPLVLTVTLFILGSVNSWDCYNQKCWGIGTYNETWINCDQLYQYCETNYNGYPQCQWDVETGNGTNCQGYFSCSYHSNGDAYCDKDDNSYFIACCVGFSIFGIIVLMFIIRNCIRYNRRGGFSRLAVVQIIDVVAPPTDYGATAYPAQPGGYPAQPGGYPAQPGGYPGQPGGYPAYEIIMMTYSG